MSQIENQKPLVSVIIVNWNGEKWLKKCLDSLHSQTYKNFEIILVDNASTDGSVKFVRRYYPEVRCIENDRNLGFAAANNRGIGNAKGEYILFLNTDTWVEHDFLERIVGVYSELGYDVVAPLEAHYDGTTQVPYIMTIDPLGHGFGMHNSKKEPFYLSGACLFFSKALYEETGGLDGDFFMYSEEVDWFWRLHLLGKKIYQDRDILVYHAGAGSTGRGVRYNTALWRNQNVLQMLLKNYSWHTLLWVLPIYFLQNLVEILFFLLILKPGISWSYIEGWVFNATHFMETLKKKEVVQKRRIIDDREIMRKMYLGSGAFYHLLQRLKFGKTA